MSAPRMRCPVCGRLVECWHERRDQRGLAQDLRVLRSHGSGRMCAGSGKRVAPDDPRLVPNSVWSQLAEQSEARRVEIEHLQRALARAEEHGPRPRIEVM